MAFSQAQHNGVIDELAKLHDELASLTRQIRPAAERGIVQAKLDFSGASQFGPGGVLLEHVVGPGLNAIINSINWAADELTAIAHDLLQRLGVVLAARHIPAEMSDAAQRWLDEVRSPATTVAGWLDPSQLRGAHQWESAAGSAYTAVIGSQSRAAGRIGTAAERAATTAVTVANAGIEFYTAVTFAVAGFVAALAGAIASLVTVFGVGVAIGAAAGFLVQFDRAVSSATTLQGALAAEFTALRAELTDNTDFPGGRWPRGRATIAGVDAGDGTHHNVTLLREDAASWDARGGELETAVSARDALMFPCTETSVFGEVVLAHYAMVEQVTSRCQEGSAELVGIAGTLRAAADTYEGTEQDNTQSFRGIDP